MKKTIVKFSAAAFMMGMFLMLPSCKEKPAEDATETTVTDSLAVTDPAADVAPAAAEEEDTTKGVKQPG